MQRIDAHTHFSGDEAEAFALFERLGLKLLNVCVARDDHGGWRGDGLKAAVPYQRLAAAHPEYYGWATSFDLPRFDDPDYAEAVIAQLDEDFAAGAVGCKVWKNIGMELRRPNGEFVMVDDPIFEPVFAHLEKTERTVIAHLGEPRECWMPLDQMKPHRSYYSSHPEWHMYGKPDFPSHQEIVDARDRLLERHPKLRFVGAHLGSLEYDVAEVARRFERFPRFAVDCAARLHDLAWQDADTVRRFFLDYPDRILYATDFVLRTPTSMLPPDERGKVLARLEAKSAEYASYFESSGKVELNGREFQGLGLPDDVLEKFYAGNARHWYPGL